MEIFVLKTLVVGKLGLFSGIWNDALMHCEGLNGQGKHSNNEVIICYDKQH